MASPQLENGYLRVANALAEALARTRLSAYESNVVWAVLRLTYGYSKRADSMSYGQIASLTCIPRRRVIATVQALAARRVLHSAQSGTRKANIISINKDFDSWLVPNQALAPSAQPGTTLVPNQALAPSAQPGTLLRQKKRQKNPPTPQGGDFGLLAPLPENPSGNPKPPARERVRTCPDYVPEPWRAPFGAWLAYKAERGPAYTSAAARTCFDRLKQLANDDPAQAQRIVDRSIANNWSGLSETPAQAKQAQDQPQLNPAQAAAERRRATAAALAQQTAKDQERKPPPAWLKEFTRKPQDPGPTPEELAEHQRKVAEFKRANGLDETPPAATVGGNR